MIDPLVSGASAANNEPVSAFELENELANKWRQGHRIATKSVRAEV
jgi:NOL1/NOP2/fmu family ribosome biogenesis protein